MKYLRCFRPEYRLLGESRLAWFLPGEIVGASNLGPSLKIGIAHVQLDELKKAMQGEDHEKVKTLMRYAFDNLKVVGEAETFRAQRAELKKAVDTYKAKQDLKQKSHGEKSSTKPADLDESEMHNLGVLASNLEDKKKDGGGKGNEGDKKNPGTEAEGTNLISKNLNDFLPNTSWGTLAVAGGAAGLWYFLTRLGTKAQSNWWKTVGHLARWLGFAGIATVAYSKIAALNKLPGGSPEKNNMEDALKAIDDAVEQGKFWDVKKDATGKDTSNWEYDKANHSVIYAPTIPFDGLEGHWHIKEIDDSQFTWDPVKGRHSFALNKDVPQATMIFIGTFNKEPIAPPKEYFIRRPETATVAAEVKKPIAKAPEIIDEKDLPPSMNFLEGPKSFTFQGKPYTVIVEAANGIIRVNDKIWKMKAVGDKVEGSLLDKAKAIGKNLGKGVATFVINAADWNKEKKEFYIRATGSLGGIAPETGEMKMTIAESVQFLNDLTSDKREVRTLNPKVKLVR